MSFGKELSEKYENLLVVQTFSKSPSMAGMRIGYAIGSRALIQAMNDVKYSINSYTMNQTSLAYGVEAVKDDVYFKEITGKIIKTRQWSKEALEKSGFTCLDSSSNFLFATHSTVPAKVIFEKLKERDIFVRYFNKPRIDNYLRITIGTDEEMQKFVEAVREIVGE